MRSTSRPVRGALVVGALLAVAACGSHQVARPAVERQPSTTSSTSTPSRPLSRPVVRVTYRDRAAPDERSETGPIRYDVLWAGGRLLRVSMQAYSDPAMTEPDERWVFTWDGTRLLEYDSGADPRYTLFRSPRGHDAWDLVSDWTGSPPRREPGRDCSRLPEGRTLIARAAVGYSCRYAATADSDAFTERVWVDRTTGVPLLTAAVRAEKLVGDLSVDETAFSTRPPAGAPVNTDPTDPDP